MPAPLTDADFRSAAQLLHCDVAAIRAVAEVESRGSGFLLDGRPKVLFEGHIFYRYTNGRYAASHPSICYKTWTSAHYAKGPTPEARGAGEWARLHQAIALDRKAALVSASYGKFQIMGFNYLQCGALTIEDFVKAMHRSEGEHLNAFCNYLRSVFIDDELRAHNWAEFARRYNGPLYQKNQYQIKLANAYAKFKGMP